MTQNFCSSAQNFSPWMSPALCRSPGRCPLRRRRRKRGRPAPQADVDCPSPHWILTPLCPGMSPLLSIGPALRRAPGDGRGAGAERAGCPADRARAANCPAGRRGAERQPCCGAAACNREPCEASVRLGIDRDGARSFPSAERIEMGGDGVKGAWLHPASQAVPMRHIAGRR